MKSNNQPYTNKFPILKKDFIKALQIFANLIPRNRAFVEPIRSNTIYLQFRNRVTALDYDGKACELGYIEEYTRTAFVHTAHNHVFYGIRDYENNGLINVESVHCESQSNAISETVCPYIFCVLNILIDDLVRTYHLRFLKPNNSEICFSSGDVKYLTLLQRSGYDYSPVSSNWYMDRTQIDYEDLFSSASLTRDTLDVIVKIAKFFENRII